MNITRRQHQLALIGINIAGLNLSDKQRIEEVGFTTWLNEVSQTPPTPTRKPRQIGPESDGKARRTRVTCEVCSGKFLAERSDAVYCSDRCRKRGSRLELKHRGPTVTINDFASSQPAVSS